MIKHDPTPEEIPAVQLDLLDPVLTFTLRRPGAGLVVALDAPCEDEGLNRTFQAQMSEYFQGTEEVSFDL